LGFGKEQTVMMTANNTTRYIPGKIISIAHTAFVILDVMDPENSNDSQNLFLLTLKTFEGSKFGKSSNFATSTLLNTMNNWMNAICADIQININSIPWREVDLVTLDGYKQGIIKLPVAPLTLNEYQKYVDIIPHCEKSYWLATGRGGPNHIGAKQVFSVLPNGIITDSVCTMKQDMRPAFIIPISTIQNSHNYVEMEEIVKDISTDILLAELKRRLTQQHLK
jgi:hypothetical protein